MALQEQVNKGMEAVSEFFQGNPFTSPVGQRIGKDALRSISVIYIDLEGGMATG